jgi:hypothetical protein
MRLRLLVSAGIVLGGMLLASVASAGYPADTLGLGNTEVWVMNLHESLDANVVASFFDRDGSQTQSLQATIDPFGNVSFPASSSGLRAGWLGSVGIDSLRPIASIATTIWEDVPDGDGWSAAAINDAPQGANDIFFPFLFKTGSWRSVITIQCLDVVDCAVSMTYRNRGGDVVSGSPFLDLIESFSQETYDLWDPSVNPNIPNDSQMVANWHGSLQVTSSGSIAGAVRTHSENGHAYAYNAVADSGSTEIFCPRFARRNFGGNWGYQSDWTAVSVQNTHGFTVTVYLSFYNQGGQRLLDFSAEIPAYGSDAYNARYGTQWPFDELPDGFNGSAVVTSTQSIVGSCTLQRAPGGGMSGGHYAPADGHARLAFPLVYRIKEGATWRYYSGISIQNVDPENEITVHLAWMDADGTVLLEFDDDIAAYASHGYNTSYGDEEVYGDLGANWTGTVVVSTDSPSGIAGIITNQADLAEYQYLTQYNGVPIE